MDTVKLSSYLLITYLIAAIPFGLLFAKFFNAGDLRTSGSGNIGASNAWRTGGKWLGILTFVFDVLKGFLFVYFAPKNINPETVAVVAVGAHIFSVWIGFRGGKGVATALGALWGVYPYAALASVIVWGVLMKYSKITSLSSIVAFLTLPLFGYLFYKDLNFFIMMSLIIIATHVPNIKRMIAGNEHKF